MYGRRFWQGVLESVGAQFSRRRRSLRRRTVLNRSLKVDRLPEERIMLSASVIPPQPAEAPPDPEALDQALAELADLPEEQFWAAVESIEREQPDSPSASEADRASADGEQGGVV